MLAQLNKRYWASIVVIDHSTKFWGMRIPRLGVEIITGEFVLIIPGKFSYYNQFNTNGDFPTQDRNVVICLFGENCVGIHLAALTFIGNKNVSKS